MRDMGPYIFLAVSLRFYIRVKVVFPSGLVVKNSPANAGDWTLGQEDLLQKERATIPVFLPGKSHDRGIWQAAVLGVVRQSDTT